MKKWIGWVVGCAMSSAPAVAVAQRLSIAPDLTPEAAATVDSLLESGTAMLLAQVGALTAPGRDAHGEPMEQPCWQGPQSGELAFAGGDRPLGIAARAIWEIRAARVLRGMREPHSICFPPGQERPNRVFLNVIRFNSRFLSMSRMATRRYVLRGYLQPAEAVRVDLGYQRAVSVCTGSSDALQHRLAVDRLSPVSTDLLDARWVHYRAAVPGQAAGTQRSRCQSVQQP